MNRIGKFRQAFASSVFVNVLNRVAGFFHSKICTSKTAQLLTSYDLLNTSAKDSFASKLIYNITPRKKSVIGIKNTVANNIENSMFYTTVHKIFDIMMGTQLRMYGLVLFIIGVFAAGIGVIEKFFVEAPADTATVFWQGIGFIVFSLPMLASKEELCTSLVNSRVGRGIIHFLGYKSEDVMRKPIAENTALAVLVGVVLGAFSIAVQPLYYIVAILAVVYVSVVFNKPEISVIITVSTLPFLPTMLICAEITLTYIAFFFKVIRGKRSVKFDLLDVFVLIFAVLMLFGGLFSVTPSSSIPPACVFVCFISVYFLIVNLIKTTDLLNKLLSLSIVSFFICSVYGIYQNFFATPDTTWTDEDMFSEIETRVVSTFENPNVFGEYLIMLIPVALAFVVMTKSFSQRTFSFVALAASVLALVYTWSRGAWLGCIASLIIFFVIINKNALGMYAFGVLLVPLAIPVLPPSIIDRFASIGNMTDSSTSYRVYIWEASANMIKDYLVSGIGIGTDAFQTVYSEYALAGIETAPHSHNLYLQLLIELGVFGFAVFAFTILLFYSKVFTFMKNSDSGEAKLLVGAISCGLLAILAQGLTDYVWYNYRVFAFFWMMLAVAVTALNIYKSKERTEENIV